MKGKIIIFLVIVGGLFFFYRFNKEIFKLFFICLITFLMLYILFKIISRAFIQEQKADYFDIFSDCL